MLTLWYYENEKNAPGIFHPALKKIILNKSYIKKVAIGADTV